MIVFFIGFGTSVNFFSNFASMLQSLGDDSKDNNIVVYFGVAQTIGRLVCVAWTGYGLVKQIDINPLYLVILSILVQLVVNFVAWITVSIDLVKWYTYLIGFSYGLMWSIFIVAINYFFPNFQELAELYAVAYFVGPGIGPLTFNFISGYIYDEHGTTISDGSVICTGISCYNLTYLISWITNVVARIFIFFLLRVKRNR